LDVGGNKEGSIKEDSGFQPKWKILQHCIGWKTVDLLLRHK